MGAMVQFLFCCLWATSYYQHNITFNIFLRYSVWYGSETKAPFNLYVSSVHNFSVDEFIKL